jgi:hypothetical protein
MKDNARDADNDDAVDFGITGCILSESASATH